MAAKNTQPSEQESEGPAPSVNHCPVCGEQLDEKSFAEHMGQGLCPRTEKPENPGPPENAQLPKHWQDDPDPEDVPMLEDAPEGVSFDEEELERRRVLAEILTENGVWPES